MTVLASALDAGASLLASGHSDGACRLWWGEAGQADSRVLEVSGFVVGRAAGGGDSTSAVTALCPLASPADTLRLALATKDGSVRVFSSSEEFGGESRGEGDAAARAAQTALAWTEQCASRLPAAVTCLTALPDGGFAAGCGVRALLCAPNSRA